MTASTPKHVLSEIWRAAGHPEAALDAVDLTGNEPVLPSSFRVGTAAQATIAAAALAASELWRLRTGRFQGVSVGMRSAAIEFRSERYLRVDGKPPSGYPDPIPGLYRCGGGRWARLHTNLPYHRDGFSRYSAAADVLLITASHLPSMQPLVIDTGRGKLSASIDLRQASERETLASVLRDVDVFVQGYRPR